MNKVTKWILRASAVSAFFFLGTAETAYCQDEIIDIPLSSMTNWVFNGVQTNTMFIYTYDEENVFECDLSSIIDRTRPDYRYYMRFDGIGERVVGAFQGKITVSWLSAFDTVPFTVEISRAIGSSPTEEYKLTLRTSTLPRNNCKKRSGIIDEIHLLIVPESVSPTLTDNVLHTNMEKDTFGLVYISENMFSSVGFVNWDQKAELPIGWHKKDNSKMIIRGVCYSKYGADGYHLSDETIIRDVKLMKLMGVNTIRTFHSPMNDFFYSVCDKYGLYVLTEIDFNGDYYNGPVNLEGAEQMLRRMISSYKHHPCIIGWGMGYGYNVSESTAAIAVGKLNRVAKELDAYRATYIEIGKQPIVANYTDFAVCPVTTEIMFPMLGEALINSAFNHMGESAKRFTIISHNAQTSDMKYGAVTLVDEQLDAYIRTLGSVKSVENKENPRHNMYGGYFVQQAFDTDTEKDGVIVKERDVAKDSYYFFKANWNPQPMLRLVRGRRNIRFESDAKFIPEFTITAFCNTGDEVTFSVDGKVIGASKPNDVCVAEIRTKLDVGQHDVSVSVNDMTDSASFTVQ